VQQGPQAALMAWVVTLSSINPRESPPSGPIFTCQSKETTRSGKSSELAWTDPMSSSGSGPFIFVHGSFAVIAMTFLIGTALTIRHEVYADNVQ
jgi:hypothetical protein